MESGMSARADWVFVQWNLVGAPTLAVHLPGVVIPSGVRNPPGSIGERLLAAVGRGALIYQVLLEGKRPAG
jgi:hypothetical protein